MNGAQILRKLGINEVEAAAAVPQLWFSPSISDPFSGEVKILLKAANNGLGRLGIRSRTLEQTKRGLVQAIGKKWDQLDWFRILERLLQKIEARRAKGLSGMGGFILKRGLERTPMGLGAGPTSYAIQGQANAEAQRAATEAARNAQIAAAVQSAKSAVGAKTEIDPLAALRNIPASVSTLLDSAKEGLQALFSGGNTAPNVNLAPNTAANAMVPAKKPFPTMLVAAGVLGVGAFLYLRSKKGRR